MVVAIRADLAQVGESSWQRDFTKSKTRLKKKAIPKLGLAMPPLSEEILEGFPLKMARTAKVQLWSCPVWNIYLHSLLQVVRSVKLTIQQRELIMNDNEGKEFAALGVKKWLIKQLFSLGIKSPTPIQKGCIQQILAGDDCIGAAKTGSGKTFAFALPILQNLSEDPYGIFALVLTPTHELAYQIADQFSILGQPLSLRVCIVTGGSDQLEESLKLAKRPHIVVAMPGRLADHITGCDTFSLKKIKYLVLDEADRLFSESFSDDLETIFNVLPAKRQNLLFSATISEEVRDSKILPLNKDRLLIWKETDTQLTVSTLDQRYAVCPAYARDVYLVQALRKYRETTPSSHVLVFTDTKKECQVLSMMLNAIGMDNVCLHGYMRQKERVAALAQFRSNLKCTLVATNVAARGLDIPSVHLVLNHKLPLEPTEYIHRKTIAAKFA
ncbi:hypothetical protein MSG28_009109 [Choristoneura fumiferana]|uniref:Uncharacterized protein n=1 Tax=Choristoneura fumiferana TaxID=7141 RepID=A0ACC0KX60_CHOFU|nr:hypothetical protein MSG28_009109 [Choristoneura fumiferana]